jgi:formate hydrogenlyase subunit 3/multisubunit Na+/H+ antiporter MnhD subunit
MIGGPLILVAIPLAAAVVTFLLRPFRTVSALVAALVLLVAAVLVVQTPPNEPQTILGRTVALNSGDRIGIAYLFVVSAVIFLSARLSAPGWSYHSIVLLSIGALATAFIYRPPLNEVYPSFTYAALFVAIASALFVFPLQGERPGVTGGALRFVTLTTLALPALLLADWTLSQLTQSPDSPELIQATSLLVVIGFTLLLAVVPFHSWVPVVASEAPPPSTALVLNVLFGAVWILLLDVMNENALIGGDPRVLELLRSAGLLMTAMGGLLVWAQHDFGRLLGYAALADTGVILYAVGLGTSAGLASAFLLVIGRAAGMGLMTIGMALARERHKDDSFQALRGLVWRMPWASLAIVAGGFSLAGVPPLAGFAGRWGVAQQAAQIDWRAAALLLASGVSVAIGMLRGLREMLNPLPESETPWPPERIREAALIVAALALCLVIGLFPGFLAPLVSEFVAAFSAIGR